MSSLNESSPYDLLLSTAQVVPLATYTVLVTLLGLFGNTLVIYSSIRYNAIKLDKVSLLFVQNLAIGDLLYVFCNVIPSAVTYIAREYVLGKVYCFISAQTSFIPASINTLTVLALTLYRLFLVLYPFSSISSATARILVAVIWVASTSGTVISLSYKSKSLFDQKSAKCFSTVYTNKAASTWFRGVWGAIVFVPLIAITIVNALLCVIAFRSSRKYNRASAGGHGARPARALTTVCLLSGLFIVSWVPYIVYLMWKGVDPDVPGTMALIALHCIQLNSFGNPILYTMTNRRFGRFVLGMVRGALPGSGATSGVVTKNCSSAAAPTSTCVNKSKLFDSRL